VNATCPHSGTSRRPPREGILPSWKRSVDVVHERTPVRAVPTAGPAGAIDSRHRQPEVTIGLEVASSVTMASTAHLVISELDDLSLQRGREGAPQRLLRDRAGPTHRLGGLTYAVDHVRPPSPPGWAGTRGYMYLRDRKTCVRGGVKDVLPGCEYIVAIAPSGLTRSPRTLRDVHWSPKSRGCMGRRLRGCGRRPVSTMHMAQKRVTIAIGLGVKCARFRAERGSDSHDLAVRSVSSCDLSRFVLVGKGGTIFT
jgi:hypothetical protein